MSKPLIIVGAQGIYGSPWHTVRKISKLGQIGVISSASMHNVLYRILRLGDPGGHYKRALEAFPDQGMAERVYGRYYKQGGIPPTEPFKPLEKFSLEPSRELIELTIVANFCQAWLAKENHDGIVGVNFLEKIQMLHSYALLGLLIANINLLFIGAGIATQFPKILDKLVRYEQATYKVDVIGRGEKWPMEFNPREYLHCTMTELKKPLLIPIISLFVLAKSMTKMPGHGFDGFVIESPKKGGGHSMKARTKGQLTDDGQPMYGKKDEFDEADFPKLQDIGLPFYLAGGYASPEKLAYAQSVGAAGIQVASIITLSEDSGYNPEYRDRMRRRAYNDELDVFISPDASPFGFPFKVVRISGTHGDPQVYAARKRRCFTGLLLQPCIKEGETTIRYRCSAEPIDSFCAKGGDIDDTFMTVCLCEGLKAGVDLPQRLRDGTFELPVFTLSNDLSFLPHLMSGENDRYWILDAFKYLLSKQPAALKQLLQKAAMNL